MDQTKQIKELVKAVRYLVIGLLLLFIFLIGLFAYMFLYSKTTQSISENTEQTLG